MSDQAKITIAIDGVSSAARAAQDIQSAWSKSASTISSAWAGVGRSIAGTAAGAVQDLARVALAADSINFAGAVKEVIALNGAMERMSLASGRSAADIKRQFTDIGNKIGEQPEKVGAWQRSVNRTIYDFDKATMAVNLLSRAGFEAGRSFEEMGELASVLGRSTSSAGELSGALGVIRSQMSLLGNDKGKAILDHAGTIASGAVGKFAPGAIKTKGGLAGQAGAIQTALIEQGMDPLQAAETAGTLINDVANDPKGYEIALGMKRGSLTDKFGRIKQDPITLLTKYQAAIKKYAGKNPDYARHIAGNVLGAVAGGAETSLDFGRVKALTSLGELGPLMESPVDLAPTLKTEAQIKAKQREAVEPLLPFIQRARGLAADHPIASKAGEALISGGSGYLLRALTTGRSAVAAAEAAAEGGALAAGEGVTAAGLGAGAAILGGAGAGLGGLAVGHAIDSENRLGDKIAGGFGGGWNTDRATIGMFADGTNGLNERLTALSGGRAAVYDGGMSMPPGFARPDTGGMSEVFDGSSLQAVLTAAFTSSVSEALKSADFKITVINQTSAPIDAVNGDKDRMPVRN